MALEKLKVQAFDNPACKGTPLAEFTAQVNPTEISMSLEPEYDEAQGGGTTAARRTFKRIKPGDLSVTFFLDGTGADGTFPSFNHVQEQIDLFREVTGYRGRNHKPSNLKVAWGKLPVFYCVLKSAAITYKLFRPEGIPLRATIAAVFTEALTDKDREAQERNESPDLTHVRLIKAGDTLPRLCAEIYGDPRYYIEVARHNDLDLHTRLTPGTRLVFPPLER